MANELSPEAIEYKRMQDAQKAAQQLMIEILGGVSAGENICSLFLKATRAIALATDNKAFADQIEKDVPAIYGYGLHDPLAIGAELDAVKERLSKLEEAVKEAPEEERKRIERAIIEHKKQVQMLS